jgi:hypothetical protein
MDHLPVFTGGLDFTLKVPYLVTDRWGYDGGTILSFPTRKGINAKLLQAGDLQGHSWEDCMSFLQSWLFFGFIIDVFQTLGFQLRPDDFSRDEGDGSRTIHTGLYPKLVIIWEMMERGSGSGREARLRRIDTCISLVKNFVDHNALPEWSDLFTEAERRETHLNSGSAADRLNNSTVGAKLLLSIVWLLETLDLGRSAAYSSNQRIPSPIGNERFTRLESHSLPDVLLLRAGWCPYEIDTWRVQGSNSIRWYLGQFQRRGEPDDHSGCTINECTSNSIKKETYRTRHVADGCTCTLLHSYQASEDPESDTEGSVAGIIRKGHVPLIVARGVGGEEKLEVRSSKHNSLLATMQHLYDKNHRERSMTWAVRNSESKPVIPYVAISHVWRSGLGNPYHNSLPRCQLVRIQALVNVQYPKELHPIPFWMDTLCVPLDRSLRKKAIQGMKSIYQQADKVLVLDTTLEHYTLSPDPLINLTRIAFSAWMQRLWTYQEGILASELVFQFRDQAVRGEDIVKHLDNKSRRFYNDHIQEIKQMIQSRCTLSAVFVYQLRRLNTPIRVDHPWTGRGGPKPRLCDIVARSMRQSYKDIRIAESKYTGTLIRKKADFEALAAFSHPLQWRKTTKVKDEALVLANLLGVDLKSLLDARNELTLKQIFQHMNSAPLDLLFIAREHFIDNGCRWMPTSLIDGRLSTHLREANGTITPQGLVVDLPGVIISNHSTNVYESSALIQICDRTYSLNSIFLNPDHTLLVDPTVSTTEALVLERRPSIHTMVKTAIITNVKIRLRRCEGLWIGCMRLIPVAGPTAVPDNHQTLSCSQVYDSQNWCIG